VLQFDCRSAKYAESIPEHAPNHEICSQVIEKKEHIDFKRHALFCCFGFGYLGCFQYWLYNVKFVQVSYVSKRAPGCDLSQVAGQ
jgi:hypothetical protein